MVSTDKEYVKIRIDGILDAEEISRGYEMTSEELVEFHNKHCALHELLTLTLPKYVEYLYIPEKAFKKQESNQLKSTKLDLPNTESTKVYGVIVKFFPKELQLHYKINVKRIQNTIELVKEKTYTNNQEIDSVIEQLFEKAEQSLYPLKINTTANGNILSIENAEEIKNRWKLKCFPELKEYYVSELADNILGQLDVAFMNLNKEDNLYFENGIWFKLFFLPIYQCYTDFSRRDIVNIYIAALMQNITYNIEYILDKEYVNDKIILTITGKEEDTIYNQHQRKGQINIVYKLYKNTHEIYSVAGVISAFEKDKEHKIEFQLYELE